MHDDPPVAGLAPHELIERAAHTVLGELVLDQVAVRGDVRGSYLVVGGHDVPAAHCTPIWDDGEMERAEFERFIEQAAAELPDGTGEAAIKTLAEGFGIPESEMTQIVHEELGY